MHPLINPHIQTLSPKSPGPAKGPRTIRLDKGELPFEPPPGVLGAIAQAATTSNRYPPIQGGALREALAAYTGVGADQIILGNGSDDLIELLMKVFVQPGDEVLLPIPTFFVYGFAAQVLGAKPVQVNRTASFELDVAAILNHINPRTQLLFIANPNNPTANLSPRPILSQILDQVSCIVVVDECYYEISQATVLDWLQRYPNLVILRSFSKSFGLAGLRLGYGVASPEIVNHLYRAAQLFPVNSLALAAGMAVLEELPHFQATLDRLRRERRILAQELETLGFKVYPSATNFLFVGTAPLGIPSQSLVQALQKRHIFVADFGLKPGLDAYYFRTAVGTSAENQALLLGLREAIAP